MRLFQFVAPRTLDEAIEAMAGAGGEARALAGGSDLIDQIRTARRTPSLVVDIKNIPEMVRLEYVPGQGLHIGAGVSCTAIAQYPPVGEHYPSVKESCLLVGSVQIQNRATIGGNVCNAAPSADTVPPLLIYGARGIIVGPNGRREVFLNEFFLSPSHTILDPAELMVEIILPDPAPNSTSHYQRFIPREEMDIAVAGAASLITLDRVSGRCNVARIALASVAPTPVRASEVENALEGRVLTRELIKAAADLAPMATNPISDVRGSKNYRAELSKVLVYRTLELCLSDMGI